MLRGLSPTDLLGHLLLGRAVRVLTTHGPPPLASDPDQSARRGAVGERPGWNCRRTRELARHRVAIERADPVSLDLVPDLRAGGDHRFYLRAGELRPTTPLTPQGRDERVKRGPPLVVQL